MRDVTKCSVWTAASLLAAVLLLSAGSPAVAIVTEVKPLSWDVAGIGASGRTLRLTYQPAGGCGGVFLGRQSRVIESTGSVLIEPFDLVDFPPLGSDPPLPCPASLPAPRPMYVTLAAPLAGRAIKGRIAFAGTTAPTGPPTHPPEQPDDLIRVPRVVGFSVWEARRLIWRNGLNVEIRLTRRPVARPHVIAQGPAGRLKPRQVVRLHVAIPR